LQHFCDLGNLDKSLHLFDLPVFASEHYELPLELLDLLGESVESLLSLVRPEEVRVQALIQLPLLVHTQGERGLHNLRNHSQGRGSVLEQGVGLFQGTLWGAAQGTQDQAGLREEMEVCV